MKDYRIETVGSVSEEVNKDIGRTILKIKGAVSANNFVDLKELNLEGGFVYIQLAILKPNIVTFHIEIVTSQDKDLRITISTLYDKPRFLGASLRLPLPIVPSWMVLMIDLQRILDLYCESKSQRNPLRYKAIKVSHKSSSVSQVVRYTY